MKSLLIICLIGNFMFLTPLTHAQTWEVVTPYPEGVINDLDVPDSIHLKGNGYYAFMYSNDGGITWTNIPFSTILISVDFTDQLNGWISADSGKMYHTMDGDYFIFSRFTQWLDFRTGFTDANI